MKFENDYPNDMVRRLVDALENFTTYMATRPGLWTAGFLTDDDRLALAYENIGKAALDTIKKIEEMD